MKRFFIIATLFLSVYACQSIIAAPADQEQLKEDCTQNLLAIGKAIAAYRADHDGEMPDWLSGLHPEYLSDSKLLLCPADEDGGTTQAVTVKDPQMPCSYRYQFNPLEFSAALTVFDIDPPKEHTYKTAHTMQLKYFGNLVPATNCNHHSAGMLNSYTLRLSYDGKVYPSNSSWSRTPEAIEAARSFIQQAIAENPSGWEEALSLTTIYEYFSNNSRIPDLLAILSTCTSLSAEGLKILAQMYTYDNQPEQAIETYERLLREKPDDTESRFQLAKLFVTTERYDQARDQCRRLIESDPNSDVAHGLLAELDAIEDGQRIQRRMEKSPAQDAEMHYLVNLQRTFLTEKKDTKRTVKQAHQVARTSYDQSETGKQIVHFYQTLDETFSKAPEQWKTYNTPDGLPMPWIYSLAQDDRGVLWVGGHPVGRYNGESFTPLALDKTSLRVISSLVDKQGNIWFGTAREGVFRYGGAKIVQYNSAAGLAGDYCRDIYQDANGVIWFGCTNGLSRYDPSPSGETQTSDGGVSAESKVTFTNFTTADGLVDDHIRTLAGDSRGHLWLGTPKA